MRLSLSHDLHKDTMTDSGKNEERSYSLSALSAYNLSVSDRPALGSVGKISGTQRCHRGEVRADSTWIVHFSTVCCIMTRDVKLLCDREDKPN